MRIAVMGTGGTGGYFGGLLARAGEDVTFIARGDHLEAIRENGLAIKSVLSGDFSIPAKATDNTHDIGPVDFVLFCVKAYDNAAAADQTRPLIGPETVVLSVQNGIDNEQQIGEVIGPEHIVGCVSYVSSIIDSPGVVSQTGGPGKIVLGEMQGGKSARTETIQNTFKKFRHRGGASFGYSGCLVAKIPRDLRREWYYRPDTTPLWEKFWHVRKRVI